MANKHGIETGHIWGLIMVFSLFITLGSCCACINDVKTEYGSEELYVAPSGQIKSAPHTTTTDPDKGLIYTSLIGGVVFVVSFFGWMLTSTTGRELIEESRQKQSQEARRKGEAMAEEIMKKYR